MSGKTEVVRDRTAIAGGIALFVLLAALGAMFNPYLISLLTIVFLFAFIGQSWSLMLGLGGQLSIGHALFVGIGAYAVAVLDIRYGLSPWLGLVIGAAIAGVVGGALAWLSFRFEVRGIYFGLLTIAAAEFARVIFSGWDFVGGMQGRTLVGRADDRGCHAGRTYDVHRRVWPGEPGRQAFRGQASPCAVHPVYRPFFAADWCPAHRLRAGSAAVGFAIVV